MIKDFDNGKITDSHIETFLSPFISKKYRKQLLDDIKKFVDRSKHANLNNISQLFILLIVWIFVGNKFYRYNRLITYESRNK